MSGLQYSLDSGAPNRRSKNPQEERVTLNTKMARELENVIEWPSLRLFVAPLLMCDCFSLGGEIYVQRLNALGLSEIHPLSIGGYSSSTDLYAQLCLTRGSGKCAEIQKKFGPMDQWPLVLRSSGPPWGRIFSDQLSSQIDSPRFPEISVAPLRPEPTNPPPPMKPYSAIFNLAVS